MGKKYGFLLLLGLLYEKEECLSTCVCVGSHKADLFLSLKVTIKRRSWSQYWVIFRDKNKTKEKNSLYFVNVCGTFITYLLLLRYKKVTEVYIILHTVFIPHASEPVKCKISD